MAVRVKIVQLSVYFLKALFEGARMRLGSRIEIIVVFSDFAQSCQDFSLSLVSLPNAGVIDLAVELEESGLQISLGIKIVGLLFVFDEALPVLSVRSLNTISTVELDPFEIISGCRTDFCLFLIDKSGAVLSRKRRSEIEPARFPLSARMRMRKHLSCL